MKIEIRTVAPVRLANIMAVVYGSLTTAFAIVLLPFFLLVTRLSPEPRLGGTGSLFLSLIFLIAYPVMGVVMGWLMGLLGSAVYNLVVRWTGGVILEWRELDAWGNPVVKENPASPFQPAT